MTVNPPYRFERDRDAASLHEQFDSLEAGAGTGVAVSVAGRVLLHRPTGKLCFSSLVDSSGAIQLFGGASWTDRFDELSRLNLGDWIGATGEVVKTRTGELSVKVQDWVVLAEVAEGRSFGDKWKGVSDVDLRFRQRYVDLWANEESRQVFLLRSRAISLTRRWLEDRGYIEVETPLLQAIPGGGHAKPFVTHHNALDVDLYLRIAPELYLKRLVVGGVERVYEIARNFRNEGISTRHNPEFTMLEFYQAYSDYQDLMTMTEELIGFVATSAIGKDAIQFEGNTISLRAPFARVSLRQAAASAAANKLGQSVSESDLRDHEKVSDIAARLGVSVDPKFGPGKITTTLF